MKEIISAFFVLAKNKTKNRKTHTHTHTHTQTVNKYFAVYFETYSQNDSICHVDVFIPLPVLVTIVPSDAPDLHKVG